MSRAEVRVPDLGDFETVDVIELHVAVGDTVSVEDPLITLETDKATMDVPSPQAGVVASIGVAVGDKVAAGDLIVELEAEKADAQPTGGNADGATAQSAAMKSVGSARDPGTQGAATKGTAADGVGRKDPAEGATADDAAAEGSTAKNVAPDTEARGHGDVAPARSDGSVTTAVKGSDSLPAPEPRGKRLVVLGSGPGGYTAAFRAADLGLEVTLIERYASLGGVCLNVGCIPSKALLHAARVVEEAKEMAAHGIDFGAPRIDSAKLREWKNRVVGQLTKGLGTMAKQRKVRVVQGTGRFVSADSIEVSHGGETQSIEFDQCIVAAGSESMRLPDTPDDPRIMDSTSALELEELPERLLVIGGGIIGLEMATMYDALGVKVSVVELTKTLIPGCDRDVVRPLEKRLASRYEAIMLGTRVTAIEAREQGIEVRFEGEAAPAEPQLYGRVLVAVGRRPNGRSIGADAAGIDVDERGFIGVDRQMRTNVPHIFAIGDIVGQPMLAHKASHEGKVAAEAAAGHKSYFDARVIPSVAYTDPEVAWVGLREEEAKAQNVDYEKGVFPWAASGRALSLGRSEGMTKLLFDPATKRLLGAGIVGINAGDLIAEAAHAIEMGSDAEDLGLTVHPHPTLSETIAFAAEAAAGTITDLYIPKR